MNTIDFDNLPNNHQTTVNLPYTKVMQVLDRLYKSTVLDCFRVTISPPFVGKVYPLHLTITFQTMRGGNLSGLLALLGEYVDEMTWESGDMIYTVDYHGFVLNSWPNLTML